MTSASYDVKLVIYDLSKGNRKSLTDRLLGIANLGMDIIPHTGIIVYGTFFISLKLNITVQKLIPQQ